MTEPPLVELQPHEWRLKGAKRAKPPKPFTPQPTVPRGKAIYHSPIFGFLAVVFGIWAACVIAWAHSTPGQNAWTIAFISMGPISLMLVIMWLADD